MKRDEEDRIRATAQRNEADLRMVGGIVGVFSGAAVGFGLEMRILGHAFGVSPWVWLVIPFIAAIIGGAIGYYQDTWRSGV